MKKDTAISISVYFAVKLFDLMTDNTENSNISEAGNNQLESQVTPLLENVLYPSESDEAVTFVTCYLKQEEPLTVSQIKDWLMLPPSVYVEETTTDWFWEPVTTEQDWYGEEEKSRTAAYRQIQEALAPLTGCQVFRVGDTEVDVYLLGRLPDGSGRAGLKTRVIET